MRQSEKSNNRTSLYLLMANLNHNVRWSLIERFVVYELYSRPDRKSLAADNIAVIATAQDLMRSIGSVTARIGNYYTLSNDYLSPIIDRLFNGDWMLVSRILSNIAYKPRISFLATQSALRYLNQFPASAAHTLMGGRPAKQGFTPRINLKLLIKSINACAPHNSQKFDIESLLLDINYIFVTSHDDGTVIRSIYEDETNYADPSNTANAALKDFLNSFLNNTYLRDLLDELIFLQKQKQEIESRREVLKEKVFYRHIQDLENRIRGIEDEIYKIASDIGKRLIFDGHPLIEEVSGHSEHNYRPSETFEPIYTPKEEEEDREHHHRDLLGCYLPGKNTILLWVDKISAYGDIKELVFQKVLLHECIHALLDVKRKSSQNNWEETIDNTWVLQAYSNCGQPAVVNEVIDFIACQPQEYRDALSLYPWMQAEKLRLNIIKDKTRNLLNHK